MNKFVEKIINFWLTKFKKHEKILSLTLALVFFATLIQSQIDLNSGLVAYYPLEGSAIDYSPYAIQGVVNSATIDIGKNGYSNSAFHFNGIDQYIDCSDNSRGITDKVTVSAWIMKSTTSSVTGHIVTKYVGINGTVQRGFHLITTSAGHPALAGRQGQGDPSGYYTISADEVNAQDGNWHHLIGTINLNEWNFWVDGSFVGSLTSTSSNPSLECPEILSIGNNPENPNGFFDGTIDEVRVYNRILNSQEISLLSDISFIDPIYTSINELELFEKPILFQNVPNPFTSETEFRFYLPKKTDLEFAVYNSLGEKISVLANGLLERGEHTIKFNTQGLSDGTYFYQVLSDSFIQTKRMAIVR